ncbi:MULTISPECIES: ergothioneine biosynthesis protein EgtC [unclassified Parafrankia]|uniref:ergothioneine biosynthesis protein EgtC n=1 Tax=unclassified Parafrankia TaxID=2994368 RepID=UPI000DA50E33|nr:MULTISPECIES: ergothioneine biosynthesis protein EgtC [unclassified Parafrankia]TCJ35411.1 ergothioneine biosynthesis protein EgtC [Parafrankia sp. BMG5.11]SQD93944.1 Amidohydrolase EgtC [Parafrankia sp. Ea1.12]
MCRHLAWLGAPRTLAELTLDRPSSLLRQSWAPRRMRHGSVNADGFGVGWYAPGLRPEPARYRRAVPMWTDASYSSFAGAVTSGCVLAAVRSATVGMPVEETATAPFAEGRLLLSHNGRVAADGALRELAARPGAPVPDSRCDSAIVAALLWESASRLPLPRAVADVVLTLGGLREPDGTPSRLNLLVTDGTQLVASTWRDTLSYREEVDGIVVASEPDDDESGWVDVPDQYLLVADTHKVTLSSLIS